MLDTWLQNLHLGDEQQQLSAISALGECENSKAVAPLVRLLHQASPPVLVAICNALAQLCDLRSIRPLLSQTKSPHQPVRQAAFAALLTIGQDKAQSIPPELIWESDLANPSPALTQIAWHTDVEAIHALQQALKDPDLEVQMAAIYTLGQLGIVSCLEEITNVLYHTQDEELRAATIYALGQYAESSDSRIQNFVLQAFTWVWSHAKIDIEEQTQLMCILSELSLPGSETFLREALQHKDDVIRQFAIIGLARIQDISSLPQLTHMLYTETSVSVKRNLLYAIATFKQKESIPTLIEYAMGKGSEIRSAVAYALQQMPSQDCWHALHYALQDHRAELRAIAAHLLAYLPNKAALSHALKDQDASVRKTALLSIGTAYLRSLRGGVQGHLHDPNWKVRVAAAESLKRLKDPASIPALRAALGDEHDVVRHAVESALNALLSFKS
jgi:HEAT repeat protein